MMTRTATSQDDQTLVDDSANECVDDNSNIDEDAKERPFG